MDPIECKFCEPFGPFSSCGGEDIFHHLTLGGLGEQGPTSFVFKGAKVVKSFEKFVSRAQNMIIDLIERYALEELE